MNRIHCKTTQAHTQSGAILIVAMIILLVLSLLGVAGMQTGVLEQKMAGHMQDREIAFQMAERALREGEEWLEAQVNFPYSSNNPTASEVWQADTLEDLAYGDKGWWVSAGDDWWSDNAVTVADLSGLKGNYISEVPSYIVSESGASLLNQDQTTGHGQSEAEEYVHIITARGVGARPTTVVYLQSTYIKRYD